ncbi:proline--tRNA ligase [archaeon]|nr:proline--tRNA ligase [archaeon]
MNKQERAQKREQSEKQERGQLEKEKKASEKIEQSGIKTKKSEDFSEWYSELVQKAELADLRYNIKGFVVYMPWAAITIKKMYEKFETVLERKGHQPLIMPSLIPESNFRLEAEHVKGFAPEVFWVTEHGEAEKFEERLALRPTSETALYQMYALWIRSYKDLPFKRYQSCQVWRCEGKATRPFLRAREFHWIEAHNVFASKEEAEKQIIEDMETTYELLINEFAMPTIVFKRPEWDKFAGAEYTYAADSLMPNGKVIQLPSTHLLGQGFAKAFNVKFADKDGKEQYGWITCYGPGISRIYGALISLHGDDKGLVLPFDLAPVQIVIVPIFGKDNERILKKTREVANKLKKYAVKIDHSTEQTPGWKYNYWEMKGVPVRIEIGPKDIEKKQLTIVRRIDGKRYAKKEKEIIKEIEDISKTFTGELLKRADKMFENSIVNCSSKEQVKKAIENEKIAKCEFCSIDMQGSKCAEIVEKEIQASVRGAMVDEKGKARGKCVFCGTSAHEIVYIAKSY